MKVRGRIGAPGGAHASLLSRVPRNAPYRRYLIASYAENTRRAYETDVSHFRRWGGRIPATPDMLAAYLACFAGNLSHATLSRRIAGIHHEHLTRGLRSPARSELVRATLRGIGRTYYRAQRRVQPLLREHLLRMLPKMRGTVDKRDRAVLLLGFLGGLRRSELVQLDTEDIEVTRAGIKVSIRRSKTDQEGVGRVVKIPCVSSPLCAVRAMTVWLRLRKESKGALFVRMTSAGTVTRNRLSGAAVAQIVKQRVSEIGIDPSMYSGHSLRAGFVTAAARAGAAAWQIKQQTGHKSDHVLAGYIRDGANAGASLVRRIARR